MNVEKSTIKESVKLDPYLPISQDLFESAARLFGPENKPKVELVYLRTRKGRIDLRMQVEERPATVKAVADVMPAVFIRSEKGNISFTLEDSPTVSLPIDFEIEADNGDIFVYIPRGINCQIDVPESPRNVVVSGGLKADLKSPVKNERERKLYLGDTWETKKTFVFVVRAPGGSIFLQYGGESVPKRKLIAVRLYVNVHRSTIILNQGDHQELKLDDEQKQKPSTR
ncbi:hypothetical protein E1B28_004805 [Marasmius oreades]|uniref:DUF7330 domain-containing protein n=1 Tax=Marasmius oreades TaxID=181124 RepID=A0A9P7UZB6_9AGAR|nr:uncharacterized protein E1B28_004805 [Marasmius oreades]KAG7097461.1 hypothetical protein E1B28_004805 [Marasmius oreades]